MKVLVTGGAGFIGSNIVDALVDRGEQVCVADNLSTGFESNLNPRAQFYRVDITEPDLAKVFDLERPQAVIHEAAQISVTRSIDDPEFDARINILGSLNLINNCVRCGVKRVIYASSCALYGQPQYLPVDEAHPVNGICHYAISKHTVEHYLYLSNLLYGLSYAALRYANVYGPRQNPAGGGGAIAIFAAKMLSGQRPTIYGSGYKSRDYVYVGDVVHANLLAMQSECNGVFNIATGHEIYDRTLFEVISRELGYDGKPNYLPERPGEIRQIYLDSSKAMKELGWTAKTRFKEGVSLAMRYYRQQKSLAVGSAAA